MLLFKRLSFWLALLGIFGIVKLTGQLRKAPPAPPPLAEPSRSPFSNTVAATGIIEAVRENVRIGAPKAGLIQSLPVQIGSVVKKGQPILQLDDREARAKLASARAQVEALRAALKAEQVMTADATDQFERVVRLEKEQIASEDERRRKEFQMQNWQARSARIEADIKSAEAQAEQARTELDILTIRAPRDGTILQINVRAGEFAGTTPLEPLMILGDMVMLQIRADVDEQNAPLVQARRPAVAFLKGHTKDSMALRLERIEPFVVPKKSLTGDSTERVDTRVLQIIYELDKPAGPLYVGQQVDVFIQRTDTQ